jgi:hypothetical protein
MESSDNKNAPGTIEKPLVTYLTEVMIRITPIIISPQYTYLKKELLFIP